METDKNINDRLIRKVLSGKASNEEKNKLNETQAVESVMRKQWSREAGRDVPDKAGLKIWNYIEEHCGIKTKRITPAITWKWVAACAAVILIAGSVWFTHYEPGKSTIEYVDFMAEQHEVLQLPDSSKIWMQPGSTVRYAKTFNNSRDVWLNGEAVFEVTKHQENPFRVYTDKAFVEVKGTVFRVSAREDYENEVTLLSGLIDFHIRETGRTVSMKPGERIKLHPDGDFTLEDTESIIHWQNGRYKFVDTRLDVLTGIISSFYHTEIVLDSDVPHHKLFNGSIHYEEHPSELIRRICYSMDLGYRTEQEKIIIYRP